MICRAFVVVLPKMEINREVRNKKKYADTFGGTVLKVQWHYTMQTKKSTMCSTVFDL